MQLIIKPTLWNRDLNGADIFLCRTCVFFLFFARPYVKEWQVTERENMDKLLKEGVHGCISYIQLHMCLKRLKPRTKWRLGSASQM